MRLLQILSLVCPFLFMSTSVETFNLACKYRIYDGDIWLALKPTFYICDVSSATVTAPNQTITSISGAHASGYNSSRQVSFLQFISKTINYVPGDLATHFVNLGALLIHSCHLKAIEKHDIQALTKLKILYLPNNDLQTLKSDLFESNFELEYVFLYNNKLKRVGLNILKPLTKLIEARFNNNTCIDKDAISATQIAELKTNLNENCQGEYDENNKLCRAELDDCTSENLIVSLGIEKEKDEVKRLTAEAKISNEKIKNIEAEYKKALLENERKQTEIGNLKLENEKERERNEKLEVDNENASLDIERKKKEIARTITENEELLTKLGRAESQILSADGNLDAATQNLFDLRQIISANASFNYWVLPSTEDSKLFCQDSKDKNICYAHEFKVRFEDTKVEVTDQNNTSVIQSSEIITLMVINMQTLFLPIDLAEHFPKLTQMSVVNSGLFEINREVFKGMFNLKFLNLTQNKLREVKTGTFNDQRDLTELDLSFNNIKVLNPGAFDGLTKLELLLLNNNLLFRIDGRAIENLSKLKKLTLHNNKLKYISPTLLSPFTKLSSADLTNNKCVDLSFPKNSLEAIESHLTDNCVAPIDFNCNFEVIDLADGSCSYTCSPQNLRIVKPNTFISNLKGKNLEGYGFSDIKTLMISGQTVEFLPFEMSKSFPKLERIIVENSKLSKLQAKDFDGMKSLNTIVIRGNKIQSIHPETFNDVPQIEHLDLAGNGIKELPSQVFAALNKMKTLIMSNNEIERLDSDIIGQKNEIENFIFNNSQLKYINQNLLKILQSANAIDFTGNKCINQKFVESDQKTKTVEELYGSVGFKCHIGFKCAS